ncbi:FAD-binding oxidoreductase [Acidipropionibacterium virtanenii]|uniref:FAD-binding oxidoreductase n=1 Tax=Acidipropionibacterium virtanenii TaxID=2057246 RepID=UPI0015F02949|nr:FAD-binding protein [Acidipropionibacterium virtanenii]
MSPAVLPGEEFAALRSRLHGRIRLPFEEGWDAARTPWQLVVDQRPAAVVEAADIEDVALTVREARRLGLAVAPQSTGHGAGTLDASGAILLRTRGLTGITVDPDSATARAGAGATAGALAAAAQDHGLTAVLGMAPTVGVVGMILGGGLGWFARSHGLAANSVTAIEGVDATGATVRADATRQPDLFWAARGGEAPIIVTALELSLHRTGDLQAGALVWPIEATDQVVRAWGAWIADLPETVTSLVRVLRYPPIPEIPEPLRGRDFVAVEAALQAGPPATAELLAPLRAMNPMIDTVHPMAPVELAAVHGDPPDPVPAAGSSVLLGEISPKALDAFIAAALAEPSGALLSIELRHLGGALAPGRAGGGAVSDIGGEGLVYCVGMIAAPPMAGAVSTAAAAVSTALAPFAAPRIVKNFAERPADPTALYGTATDRLRGVIASWDPDGLIRAGHPLGAVRG